MKPTLTRRCFLKYSAAGAAGAIFPLADTTEKVFLKSWELAEFPSLPKKLNPVKARGMDRAGPAAGVTARSASPVGFEADNRPGRLAFHVNALAHDLHSCKREIGCYTQAGHRAAPFASQVLVTTRLDPRRTA